MGLNVAFDGKRTPCVLKDISSDRCIRESEAEIRTEHCKVSESYVICQLLKLVLKQKGS